MIEKLILVGLLLVISIFVFLFGGWMKRWSLRKKKLSQMKESDESKGVREA